MVEIIQISDLHYGSNHFRENLMLNVVDYINDSKPDLVMCTGDVTHRGHLDQYQKIKSYFDRINTKILCVVGNHDAKYNGIINFEKFIGPRRSKIVLKDEKLAILGLQSAKDDFSEGELGDEQLSLLINELRNHSGRKKILALHHHLIAVPYAGRTRSTLLDAGEALEIIRMHKVDLVCMGHRHVPHVWTMNGTTFLYCGTSASIKVRANEAPSFNHINMEGDDLEINTISSDDFEKSLLLRRKEEKIEYIRHRKARIDYLVQETYKNEFELRLLDPLKK
ncbi:MAG: metallophosphoesterase [Candidatus Lokiarchaeota archaeon]|nr:metallophosphoesterase [Candidatus Lokiarchaeota archaeon]MBD3339919.1 metallophosphoesterase [Candidatus Lokiarchaeota archaeon]